MHLHCGLQAGDPSIFPNSKFVQAKQQFSDDRANSLVLHLPTRVTRTSGSTIKLEWKIDTRLSCIHICGKRYREVHCTSTSKSLVSTMHSSLHHKSTCELHILLQMQLLQDLSHRIYGKMYLLLLGHRELKQTELSDV